MAVNFKKAGAAALMLVLLGGSASAQYIGTTDLSTGVQNGTSNMIPYASPDDTWQVAGPGAVGGPDRPGAYWPAYVCSNLNGSWAVSNCARWITPYLEAGGIEPSAGAYAGLCTYRRSFSMDYSCMDWAQVNFSYIGGDNNVTGFKVNGHAYTLNPSSGNDYNPLAQNISFSVDPSHLHPGSNVITIDVYNNDIFTGFYACGGITMSFCAGLKPEAEQATAVSGSDLVLYNEAGPVPMAFKQDRSMGNQPSVIGDKQGIEVYPNPSNGRFMIKMNKAIEGEATILDFTGRSVYRVRLQDAVTSYPIDLSALSKGIYILSVRTPGETYTQKITLK
ncbi:T9SS type A sorting domain-containing protein [Taibaiella helva]|uniref:T9SS type A sorting domain-containing protein n=1 Tax=Taibaiella helva TaxID=2301235 RepID=UPI000E56E404|nr:T9SS type A sorting domain-containing protein [Taibaiella helva]